MERNDWTDAERRVERAAELFEQRKLDEALEELQAAVGINPYNAGWLYNLALTLDELGRSDEAIDAYKQALQLEPDDIAALYRLGVNLHRGGRYREAIETLEKVTSIDSEFESAYCIRIASHTELSEHDEAEQAFYLGRLAKEHCPTCYFNMGVSLAARGLYDRAIYCWQRTLELQPNHPQGHLKLAAAFRSRGELQRARKHALARLRQAPRDDRAMLELVDLLLQLGRSDDAGAQLETVAPGAMQKSPNLLYARGIWLLAKDRLAEAAEAFFATLQLDPTFPRAHLRMAQIRLRMGKLIEAKTHLRSELLLRPDDPRTLSDLANLLIDTSETRSAVVCLRRLTLLRPNDLFAWQNLAVAHFLRHQYDDGIAACHRALEIQSDSTAVMHNLAVALSDLGRYDEALAVLAPLGPGAGDDCADLILRIRLQRGRAKLRYYLGSLFGLLSSSRR